MKPTTAAAILALLAPAPLAAQQAPANSAMTDITCEEFLDLPAADQEMHATALTTARMDEAAPARAEPGGPTDQDDPAEAEQSATPSQGVAMPTDGITSNILSPTVVALVTICENSVSPSDSNTNGAGGSSN